MADPDHSSVRGTTNNMTKDSTRVKHNFLTIPPELRLLIYEAHFSTLHFDSFKPQPALIGTCKLIRKESLSCYEARIIERKDEHHKSYERKDAVLQQLIDTCTDDSEKTQLHFRQMDEAIKDSEVSIDHQFELAKVYRMRCEEWISTRKPKRKLSISYMRGVEIPKRGQVACEGGRSREGE